MVKHLSGIVFILVCSTLGWLLLGQTLDFRTNSTAIKLAPDMSSIWGTPQVQSPPAVSYQDVFSVAKLSPESSRVHVNLALEHRQKGLLWYSVYVVHFDGLYTFRNPAAEARTVKFQFPFPATQAVYDGLTLQLDGKPVPFQTDKDSASLSALLAAGQQVSFRVDYKSQGLESWRYKLGEDITQTRNFELTLDTNFGDIDFPLNTLPPTTKHSTGEGWRLGWRYANLISDFQIGMTMPEKLQPGPLAGEISYFAPVSLFLYFFVMFILTSVRKVKLHVMNYFFLAASFFAFHLLLAYLVDHISIELAFAISALVSGALVTSYLRIVMGSRAAVLEAGLAQLVYLVFFSSTFFFKGYTGLAITIGCIITLFIAMQVTARTRWSELSTWAQ